MSHSILSCFVLIFISFYADAKIEVRAGKIEISDDVNFEKKLEVQKFVVVGKEAELNETGFIIASAQSSFENDRFSSRWVALDNQVLTQNSVNLDETAPVRGTAYGVLSTSKDFAPDVKIGQGIIIKRYGIPGDRFEGAIVKIVNKPELDIIQIHFMARNAPELIAGTTCEVDISHIRKLPFQVSLLSLLHLGLEDYIVIKEKPGVYFPKHVTIISQDSQHATILLPISAESQYVARGAILLKPLLNKILIKNDGAP